MDLIDHRNGLKKSKAQVEPQGRGECFHYTVLEDFGLNTYGQ